MGTASPAVALRRARVRHDRLPCQRTPAPTPLAVAAAAGHGTTMVAGAAPRRRRQLAKRHRATAAALPYREHRTQAPAQPAARRCPGVDHRRDRHCRTELAQAATACAAEAGRTGAGTRPQLLHVGAGYTPLADRSCP